MTPFISGFSDHWLRAERPWKKWPLQPKVAFSADVISRTGFGWSKDRIYFSPPGQLRTETFYPDQTRVAVLNPDKGKLYQWSVDPNTSKISADPGLPSEMPIDSYWQTVAVEGSYWVLPANIRESSLVKEGDQLINGIETTRYRADMDAGKEVRKAQVWIARKSGIVVRFETSPDGWPFVSAMELSNLHVSHQARSYSSCRKSSYLVRTNKRTTRRRRSSPLVQANTRISRLGLFAAKSPPAAACWTMPSKSAARPRPHCPARKTSCVSPARRPTRA